MRKPSISKFTALLIATVLVSIHPVPVKAQGNDKPAGCHEIRSKHCKKQREGSMCCVIVYKCGWVYRSLYCELAAHSLKG